MRSSEVTGVRGSECEEESERKGVQKRGSERMRSSDRMANSMKMVSMHRAEIWSQSKKPSAYAIGSHLKRTGEGMVRVGWGWRLRYAWEDGLHNGKGGDCATGRRWMDDPPPAEPAQHLTRTLPIPASSVPTPYPSSLDVAPERTRTHAPPPPV
jgi:hypothetical protein